jgi:hypothetical protein
MNTIKFLFLSAALTGVLSAHATINEPEKKGSASTAEVSYIGTLDGEPVFHVVYNNSTGARFAIRLLDADGHQIYQGVFSDKKFDKKFQIATTDLSGKLVFVVRNFQDNSVQSFQVDADTRMIEDVEVKEVK